MQKQIIKKQIVYIILAIFFGILWAGSSQASLLNPNLRSNITIFGLDSTSPTFIPWMAARFDFMNGGSATSQMNPLPYAPDATWSFYKDSTVALSDEEKDRRDFVESLGINWEDSLLHMSVDYATTSADRAWAYIVRNPDQTISSQPSGSASVDKFDGFEKHGSSGNIKGVFTYENSTYTDKTSAAYSAVGGVPINDTLYLGYGLPFDQANFIMATAGIGTTVEWEYWNGSVWTTLNVTDGTDGLNKNGQVYFIPPADWARTIVNGSYNKWWVRARVVGGSTKPTAKTITGDNWRVPAKSWQGSTNFAQYEFVAPSVANGSWYHAITGGISGSTEPVWPTTSGATVADGEITWKRVPANTAMRGWDQNDPNIVNSGELAYNPTPPVGASAKFRYQSRASGMWASNYYMMSKSFNQNGHYPAAEYLVQNVLGNIGSNNAIMWDDMDVWPGVTSPADAVINFTEEKNYIPSTYATTDAASVAHIDRLYAGIKASRPELKVGGNVNRKSFLDSVDYMWDEIWTYSTSAGANKAWLQRGTDTSSFVFLDDAKPGHIIYFVMNDKVKNAGGISPTTPTFWDRGNRGPLGALALYYIGSNPNTGFGYNSFGTYYIERDDFVYFDPASTTLTSPITADTSSGVKTITGADFSVFTAAGAEALGIGSGNSTDILSNQYSSTTPVFTKIDNTHISTTMPIYFDHAAGETVKFSRTGHQADSGTVVPSSLEDVVRWSQYFPAMGVDIGVPDSSGHNGGNKDFAWKLGVNIGGGNNVWRRDFTNAIVLFRPYVYLDPVSHYTQVSNQIDLGGTYYPLQANGITGQAITTISLKNYEGAILMKYPVGSDAIAPAAPQGLAVQ